MLSFDIQWLNQVHLICKGFLSVMFFRADMGIDTWDKTPYFTEQSKGRTCELTLGHTST